MYYDNTTGYCYRFAKQDTTYLWTKIVDSDVTEALRVASTAQDTADGKRTIFTEIPSPPYNEGDLYLKDKDLYVCNVSKESGTFEETDFIIATKYTDDTKANEVLSNLNTFVDTTYKNAMKSMSNQIDGKIATWYMNGEPTLENSPAKDWNEEEIKSHTGDMYYDKETGYSYIFEKENNTYKWTKITDKDTTEALAIANAAQDTADGKRRIFIVEPTPPYDNGDLWIKDNEIYICQISKEEGQPYQEQDFINNLKYTDNTVANAIVDELGGTETTVLAGQVVTITKGFAKFADLADPTSSTTIAGEHIKTGNISSNNYVQNQKGMNINLTKGTLDTKNFKVDEYGNINLFNGAKIIGENGLMTTYIQEAKPREAGNTANILGYYADYSSYADMKQKLFINISIPKGFEITSAKVVGYHTPVKWSGLDISATWGYVRKLKLYKAKNLNNSLVTEDVDSGFSMPSNYTYEEITGALGTDGWTATAPNDTKHDTESFETSDIKTIFQTNGKTKEGVYQIMIEPSEACNSSWTKAEKVARTAYCPSVILILEGYMTYK